MLSGGGYNHIYTKEEHVLQKFGREFMKHSDSLERFR